MVENASYSTLPDRNYISHIGVNELLFGFCYNKQNALSQTYPHLSKDSKVRKELIHSLASSTAIETGDSIYQLNKN